jgi:shikimate 5-dehydrogenase|tara:strand:+ start:6150 stop:7190 length:1041 start_codon:yes stop_codon:yes gene_type:complete
MAQVRYAIAGYPVAHSLSPLLFGLVVANLEKFKNRVDLKFNSTSLHLVETPSIEDALGWGYSAATPRISKWDFTGTPFGKFRTETLVKKAVTLAQTIEDCDASLVSEFDSSVEYPSGGLNAYTQQAVKHNLPTNVLEKEVLLSLTSPLKHQLSSDAVTAVDDSMIIQSVNSLRWDGRSWWCAGVDGLGIVSLASHFGILAEKGALLGLCGGGGAARSTAHAWIRAGGKVRLFSGRRKLELPFDVKFDTSSAPLDLVINFDDKPCDTSEFSKCSFEINPSYSSLDGDINFRIESLLSKPLDGRWMLVAQHLEAWKHLWAPQYAELLPSLGLLLTQLIHAENLLSSYT